MLHILSGQKYFHVSCEDMSGNMLNPCTCELSLFSVEYRVGTDKNKSHGLLFKHCVLALDQLLSPSIKITSVVVPPPVQLGQYMALQLAPPSVETSIEPAHPSVVGFRITTLLIGSKH